MTETYAWIAFVHAALFIVSMGYAKFLNQKKIHDWYSPDYVWLTVVGGDMLIGVAVASLCLLSILPWTAAMLYVSLHIAAGLPIIAWQQRRAEKRARELEAIERGP